MKEQIRRAHEQEEPSDNDDEDENDSSHPIQHDDEYGHEEEGEEYQ